MKKGYLPRPDSKPGIAYEALKNGPLTGKELSIIMGCRASNIRNFLKPALIYDVILEKEGDDGILFYCRPDCLEEYEYQGKEKKIEIPVFQGLNWTNPFQINSHVPKTSNEFIELTELKPNDASEVPEFNLRDQIKDKVSIPEFYCGMFSDGRFQIKDKVSIPEFSCAMFSDGRFQIIINGNLVILYKDQTDLMLNYLRPFAFGA